MIDRKKILIIGSGSWGTAIANLIANNQSSKNNDDKYDDSDVLIYSRNKDIINEININHSNKKYLPNIIINKQIKAVDNLDFIDFATISFIFIVVPALAINEIIDKIDILQNSYNNKESKNHYPALIICSKGLYNNNFNDNESKSYDFISCIIGKTLPNNRLAILSGPNFAKEVAENKFTITTIAANNYGLYQQLSTLLNNNNFYCEYFSEMLNVEICAIIKNITAIACGICDGMGFGENFKAAIISNAINEIRIACKIMQKDPILPDAACFGDIFLTCSSKTSRNYLLGYQIATNPPKNSLLDYNYQRQYFNYHCEGINSAKNIFNVIINDNEKLCISNAVKEILDNQVKNDNFYSHLNNAIKKIIFYSQTNIK
jgi:glycerol-3-phosphate dehydrogenase (NAD(P)+)